MAAPLTLGRSQVGGSQSLAGTDPFYSGALTDSASGTDAVTAGVGPQRPVTDGASGTDAVTNSRILHSALTDSASGTDAVAALSTVAGPFTLGVSQVGSADALGYGASRILSAAVADSAAGNDETLSTPFTLGSSAVGGTHALGARRLSAITIGQSLSFRLTDSASGVDYYGFFVPVTDYAGGRDVDAVTQGQGVFGQASFGLGLFGSTGFVAQPSTGPFTLGISQVGGVNQIGGSWPTWRLRDVALGVDTIISNRLSVDDAANGYDALVVDELVVFDAANGADTVTIVVTRTGYALVLGLVLA